MKLELRLTTPRFYDLKPLRLPHEGHIAVRIFVGLRDYPDHYGPYVLETLSGFVPNLKGGGGGGGSAAWLRLKRWPKAGSIAPRGINQRGPSPVGVPNPYSARSLMSSANGMPHRV